MPKLKSNRAAAKRFKVTAKGKVKKFSSGARHKATAKSPKRLRNLRGSSCVHSCELPRIKEMIGA